MLIAKNSENKSMFYDIVNIKESSSLTNRSKPEISAKPLSTNSICENSENVNSFSEKGEKTNSQSIANLDGSTYSASLKGSENTLRYKPVAVGSEVSEAAKKALKNIELITNGKTDVVLTTDVISTADGKTANGAYVDGVLYVNADNPARRENYFLLISKQTDKNGNIINVPVFINEKGIYNRVFIDTNKIATVFGRNEIYLYIREQISKGNLVRIKKRNTQASESTAPVAAHYGENVSSTSIRDDSEKVNTSDEKSSKNSSERFSIDVEQSEKQKRDANYVTSLLKLSLTIKTCAKTLISALSGSSSLKYVNISASSSPEIIQNFSSLHATQFCAREFYPEYNSEYS